MRIDRPTQHCPPRRSTARGSLRAWSARRGSAGSPTAGSPSPGGRRSRRFSARSAGGRPGGGCSCRTSAHQSAVPGQQRRGCHREDPGPLPPRDRRGQRGEPGPVGGLVPDPAGGPAQHRVLMPEHQQLGVLRLVPAEHQRNQAEQPAHQQVSDLQRHPNSQPSQHQAHSRNSRSSPRSSIRAAQHRLRQAGGSAACPAGSRTAVGP
jgi:hypothetical protein